MPRMVLGDVWKLLPDRMRFLREEIGALLMERFGEKNPEVAVQ